VDALYAVLDAQRRSRGMSWQQVAREISGNGESVPGARPLSPSTVTGMREKGALEGDGVLGMLLWLQRTPESFLAGSDGNSRDTEILPEVPPGKILRFDTPAIYAALNAQRVQRGLTWQQVADEIGGFNPANLTRLKKGGRTSFPGVMRIVKWLGRPAASLTRLSDR
jgi:hypothetical protein